MDSSQTGLGLVSIPALSHSFNKYVLSTYHVPGTVLGAGDRAANQTDFVLALLNFMIWWRRQ